MPESGEIVDACGFTDTFRINGRQPFIIITSIWFDAFEFGLVDNDKNADRLTRTVWHELVHWVREAAAASNLALDGDLLRGGHFEEAGRLFEQWAFGVATLCTDEEIWDAILSQRQ